MPRLSVSSCAVLSLGAVVAGCQTAPARYAGEGVHVTYSAAATTGGELYVGAGRAVRAPLRDLNMMQDQIAPVLLRAEARPYDLVGVNSCADVLNRVAELDLALGPDVDTPKEQKKRARRGADFAANTALDAASSAVEHFIPMRSTIKQISGAQRYENHVKHALLAGATRRSFLKAVGMAHQCSWPAAPLDFRPAQVADVNAAWTGPSSPSPATGTVALASAAPVAPSARSAVVQTASVQTVSAQTVSAQTVSAQTVSAQAFPTQTSPLKARVVMVSAATASRPGAPVFVPVHDQLALPSAAPAPVADQAWRPASVAKADVVQVSAPLTTTAALGAGGSQAAPAPWGSSFAARP